MKAVCVVAHPDDCLIYGRQYILNHKEYDWSIVYLTYSGQDARAAEVSAYWNALGVVTQFLGYLDDYQDHLTQQLSWDAAEAAQDLCGAVAAADLILTHNYDGEYGHIHHKFVAETFRTSHIRKVHFSNFENSDSSYSAVSLNLNDFPLHQDVLVQFPALDIGHYVNGNNH